MAWAYLLLAGVCEIGWPLGFKLSQQPEYRVAGIAGAIVSMGISGLLLWMAQREIPIGTAYAVWTGVGAALTVAYAMATGADPVSLLKVVFLAGIIGAVFGLKLVGGHREPAGTDRPAGAWLLRGRTLTTGRRG